MWEGVPKRQIGDVWRWNSGEGLRAELAESQAKIQNLYHLIYSICEDQSKLRLSSMANSMLQ
jgi:hypothetical protein